jgi:hypothetical protein
MKFNRLILFIGLVAVGLFMLPACTNLEVEEKDSVVIEGSGGGFVAGDPTQLLASAYNDLSALNSQENTFSLMSHPTDEIIPPTRGTDWGDNGVWRTVHAHTWDPTHSWVLNTWNQMNERAFKCNQILASSPSTQQAAEAKALRAFYSYHVMDLYGVLPFREVDEGVDVDPRVFTRAEAFDRVIADLEEALPNLPDIGPDATNSVASKAVANTLLARMYLNKAVYTASDPAGPYSFDAADMNKVIEHCDAVTAAGFSLESNYFDNFTTNATSEIIWVSPGGSPSERWGMTLHYSQNPSGWNGFTALADFYDTFDPADPRIGYAAMPDGSNFSGIGRGFLIGEQFNDDGTPTIDSRTQKHLSFTRDVPLSGASTDKGIRVIKYHPADLGKYIILRYGEVVLMKAEAIMRGGTSSETAVDVVNSLRTARGAPTISSVDESSMYDEIGFELYWEGWKRPHMVRFGRFTDEVQFVTNTSPHTVIFPIPQSALDSNPNLTQNPGY